MPYFAVGAGLYWFRNAWAAIVGYHLGILLILKFAGYAAPRRFEFTWQALLFGFAGLSAGILLFVVWPRIHMSPSLPQTLLGWGLTRNAWPVFIAYTALFNPALEELFWRGWLGSADSRPVWADAWFAGFHLVILAPFLPVLWLVIAFLVLTFTAWMWRQVTRRTDSLLPAALFHLAADVSILLIIVSEVS